MTVTRDFTSRPGYAFTVRKKLADSEVENAMASADAGVREAYRRMEKPPRFELYDLERDPHEFHNLADEPGHAEKLAELREQLAAWRRRTRDPLLHPETLQRLKTEVESVASKQAARKHDWGYLFGKWNVLSSANEIAAFFHWVGVLTMVAALILLAWWTIKPNEWELESAMTTRD